MENEIRFDYNRRKLIRACRAMVCNAQPASREILLAYAFLKERKYIELEERINEDNSVFGDGRRTFLDVLSYRIHLEIKRLKVDGLDSEYVLPGRSEIFAWIMEKYQDQTKTEEKAA